MSATTPTIEDDTTERPQPHDMMPSETTLATWPHPPAKLLYRAEEAATMLSISRSRVFELLRSNQLRSVTQGRTRLISHTALVEFVEDLEREAR